MMTVSDLVASTFEESGVAVAPSRASEAYAAWLKRARPKQIRPHANHPDPNMRRDDWLIWYLDGGRGSGKTAAGAAETVRQSEDSPFIAIIATTFADGRDVCVEGESGIKALLGADLDWNRSIGEMTFPSGAKGKIFSAERPDSLRGPNNYFAWADELCKWRYQRETWAQLMFTLRKGRSQCCITTTPRPSPLTKELKERDRTVLVKSKTYDNIANLSEAYINNNIKPYEGTTLGRQELNAEDIDEVKGALWQRVLIDANRRPMPIPHQIKRLVVSIDPATTATDDSDETGIIAAALGIDDHGYILEDKSLRGTPLQWATEAINLYRKLRADRIVAEANNGGLMVSTTLQTIDGSLPITLVYASRGKVIRAEPVSALYERNLVHHVGALPLLEDQMCTWLPGLKSPDRMDALVWALTELMLPKDNQGAEAYSMGFSGLFGDNHE
ncbi:MAG: DNA-packaging protein [Anaerolineae bacterium]|nr:DNA-packaging protein [Anaerolineae bacterium]